MPDKTCLHAPAVVDIYSMLLGFSDRVLVLIWLSSYHTCQMCVILLQMKHLCQWYLISHNGMKVHVLSHSHGRYENIPIYLLFIVCFYFWVVCLFVLSIRELLLLSEFPTLVTS